MVGVSNQWHEAARSKSSDSGGGCLDQVSGNEKAGGSVRTGTGWGRKKAATGVNSGDGSGGVACGSSLSRAATATDEAAAHDVWSRLTLRAQVFHREDSAAAAKVCTTA